MLLHRSSSFHKLTHNVKLWFIISERACDGIRRASGSSFSQHQKEHKMAQRKKSWSSSKTSIFYTLARSLMRRSSSLATIVYTSNRSPKCPRCKTLQTFVQRSSPPHETIRPSVRFARYEVLTTLHALHYQCMQRMREDIRCTLGRAGVLVSLWFSHLIHSFNQRGYVTYLAPHRISVFCVRRVGAPHCLHPQLWQCRDQIATAICTC